MKTEETPIRLQGNAFVQALQGKTVKDESGQRFAFEKNFRDSIIVNNIVVVSKVIIKEGETFRYPIRIEGGIFEESFRIHKNCIFQKAFGIWGGCFQKDFCIYDGTFLKEFWLAGGTFEHNFKIAGGTFEQEFRIWKGIFEKTFRIEGGTFEDCFKILGGTFEETVRITGGTFGKDVSIWGGFFENTFRIEGGTFEEDFKISGGYFEKNFRITGGVFEKCFGMWGGTFESSLVVLGGIFKQSFSIWEASIDEGLIIDGEAKEKMFLMQEFHVEDSILFDIKLRYLPINRLTFKGTLETGRSILMYQVSCEELVFDHFTNNGKITCHGLRTTKEKKQHPKQLIQITNSDLGDASFFDTDFSAFEQLQKHAPELKEIHTEGWYVPYSK